MALHTHSRTDQTYSYLLDTSWYRFIYLDLYSEHSRYMLNGEYTKRTIHSRRQGSMLHFLHYSCMCSNYKERRSKKFFVHIVQLYNEQQGRCVITGQPMHCPLRDTGCDPRFFVSIDRIQNNKGYEVGNVRLTLQWVNHALGNKLNIDEVIKFSSLLCFEKIRNTPSLSFDKFFNEASRLSLALASNST